MRLLRLFLLVGGCALIAGAIIGYFFSAVPKPTLIFVCCIGMAFLLWHNALVTFLRYSQAEKK